jgi:YD repeat-containing protein
VRTEIDALLTSLQSSGCQFNRNGSWYSGAEARDHLLRKLRYIERGDAIQSTEQFIELAASRSSSSGQAYQVRCDGQAAATSQTWLTRQLTAIRGIAGRSTALKPSSQGTDGVLPAPGP